MPKIALLLFGVSYMEGFNHWSGTHNRVDFRNSVENYRNYIFHYFEGLGYSIDVFIATNPVSDEIRDEIVHHYQPKIMSFHENRENIHISRNIKIINVVKNYIQYTREHKSSYTACILTRFDLHFKIPFHKASINLSSINIVSLLEKPNLICDNLYIVHRIYIGKFLVVLQNNKETSHHHILRGLRKITHVNFMYNQNKEIRFLDFYKIIRTDWPKGIHVMGVNADLCEDREIDYISNDCFRVRTHNEGVFHIQKTETHEPKPNMWIGWLKRFPHRHIIMKFNILFHNPVPTPNNGFYVKTHHPEILHSDWLLKCKQGEYVHISINLELHDIEQYILFILDEYQDNSDFCIKDVEFHELFERNIPLPTCNGHIKIPYNNTLDIQYNDGNGHIHIHKKNTCEITTHQWCGFTITPINISNIFEFDILFKTPVPDISDHFYLKTHYPDIHRNEWLLQCKQNEFVRVSVELLLGKQEHLLVFIMDEYFPECEFIVKNVNFRPNTHRYKFVSFYTEGEEIDHCINLQQSVSILQQNISKYVDNSRFYNKRELAGNPNTQHLVQKFQDEPKYNAKTHFIGYLRWKPYIILEQLLKANDGDIVYYRDCNIEKYPEILHDIEYTPQTLEHVLRNTDLFVPIEHFPIIRMKHHVKQEVVNALYSGNDTIDNKPLYNASVIVCRKNKYTIEFMRNWLGHCENDILISSEYNQQIANPDFKWNTQEQAILNILLQNEINARKLPYKYPFYSMHHREFSVIQLKRAPRVAILLAGEMRNYNNRDLLNSNNANLLGLYDCDIFVSTWTHCGKTQNHGSVIDGHYANSCVGETDIRKLYSNVRGIHIEDYETWKSSMPETYKHHYSGGLNVGEKTIDATSFPQLYKIYDANQLKMQYEKANHFTYDLVIRFRPDVCLIEQIPHEYINPFMEIEQSIANNRIWHMNPPKIFYPSRIYDIFFYGNSQTMNRICDVWKYMAQYIEHSFDNGLPKVDCCRLLYIACMEHHIQVCDIPRCMGDVYRDETFETYREKIETLFN